MKLLDNETVTALLAAAADSPRLRANHNIHPVLEDPVQRFFNAMQPGTYVRPHRHSTPPRWELFVVLRGAMALLVFDDSGRVAERQELKAEGPVFGAEVEAGRWHALVALQPSVLFELKQGPYSALTDKDFASWAPAEGEANCAAVVRWYEQARVGDRIPAGIESHLQSK
ncbi:MAG: WbuC family cupin fold metalloprotein [Gammaproteobacteria bacterium]|nr:MAG: WbuC family cupin fold metalloprotein [Gammaproteobacteria bacterium]